MVFLWLYYGRYPEAIPLRTTDAEHVAEELVTVFSRVGIPEEILTDQGSNFMSQLLAEVCTFKPFARVHTIPRPMGWSNISIAL